MIKENIIYNMFSTIHGTTGALAAKYSGNIFIGFFIAILLHFIFDFIPHGDENLIDDPKNPTKKELKFVAVIATLDIIIMSLILTLLVYLKKMPVDLIIAFGVFGGLLPDLINAICILFKLKFLRPLLNFHEKIHNILPLKLTLIQGLIFQIFVETALLILVFIF